MGFCIEFQYFSLLSVDFFLGNGRSAATGKVLSGFYCLFFIALIWLERALLMFGWNLE